MKTVVNLSTGQVAKIPLTTEEQAEFDRVKVDPGIALKAEAEAREKALEALLDEESKKSSARKEIKDYAGLRSR